MAPRSISQREFDLIVARAHAERARVLGELLAELLVRSWRAVQRLHAFLVKPAPRDVLHPQARLY